MRRAVPLARKSRHAASRRRPRGRGEKGVGEEAIVIAALKLLEQLPLHKVPNVLIARKAGIDPALIRYYFADRGELLMAVVEHILSTFRATHAPTELDTTDKLSAHVGNMFELSRRVRSMQQLMIEGCAEAKTPSVRARVRELNMATLPGYARFLQLDGAQAESSLVPLFTHVAIIGLCEFFVAAQAMILPLVPKHIDAAELPRLYETFIRKLVLDGLHTRVEGPMKLEGDS